jgi:ATP-dependent Clp protease ATP-binding subunit ClpC
VDENNNVVVRPGERPEPPVLTPAGE